MTYEAGAIVELDLPSQTLPEQAMVIDQYMQVILALRLPIDAEIAIAMLLKGAESPIDRHRARAEKWKNIVEPKLLRDIPTMMTAMSPGVRARFELVISHLPKYGSVVNPAERIDLQNQIDALMADIKQLLVTVETVQIQAADIFTGITKDHDRIAEVMSVAGKKIAKRKKKVESTYEKIPVDETTVVYNANFLYYRDLLYTDTLSRERNVDNAESKWKEYFEITLKALSAIGSHWKKVLENLESVDASLQRSATINSLVSVNMRTARANWERMARYFGVSG